MTLRLEIECSSHHICQCMPISGTKVTTQQVTYNLIRCNPILSKYFGQKRVIDQKIVQVNVRRNQNIQKQPYIPIAQQKNLKRISSYRNPIIQIQENNKQNKQVPSHKNQLVSIQTQTFEEKTQQKQKQFQVYQRVSYQNISAPTNYSDKNLEKIIQKQQNKQKLTQLQKQKLRYYQQHRQQSRYLPDSAFKNYYKRPVFFNYGYQNRHGNKDQNYLKTHNINPHTGLNLPSEQQTYHQALIRADIQKLNRSNTNLNKILHNSQNHQKLKELKRTLSKQRQNKTPQKNIDLALVQNKIYHEKIKKYHQLPVKRQTKQPINKIKIKKTDNHQRNKRIEIQNKKSYPNLLNVNARENYIDQKKINHNQYQVNNVRQKYTKNQPVKLKNSQKVYQYTEINDKQKKQQNSTSIKNIVKNSLQNQCPVTKIINNQGKDIFSRKCNMVQNNQVNSFSPKQQKYKIQKIDINKLLSPISKNSDKSHLQNCHKQCKCCYDQIKQQLRRKGQQDHDLQNRIITSARKNVLYKNYSLNNDQNAQLNPHNYRNCCGQMNKY